MPIIESEQELTEAEMEAVRQRTPEQQALVDKWLFGPRPLSTKTAEDGTLRPTMADQQLWLAELYELVGCGRHEFLSMILNDAGCIAWNTEPAGAVNSALAVLEDIDPDGPLEAMLASQMIATHRVAMEQLRRAMLKDQPAESVSAAVNRANKLLGTFSKQVEALSVLRGKTTQQKVTVKHVHVHEGGQAIVGNVNPGDGGRRRKRGKAHASGAITNAPESTLRSEGEDAERQAVPLPCDGER